MERTLWMIHEQTLRRRQERHRACEILGFKIHLAAFVLVNLLLIAINLAVTPERLWCLMSLGGWGIGIVCHGLYLFLVPRLRSNKSSSIVEEEVKGK